MSFGIMQGKELGGRREVWRKKSWDPQEESSTQVRRNKERNRL